MNNPSIAYISLDTVSCDNMIYSCLYCNTTQSVDSEYTICTDVMGKQFYSHESLREHIHKYHRFEAALRE